MTGRYLIVYLTALLIASTSGSQLPDQLDAVPNPDEQMVFAFEVVRHGARAPIVDRALDKFKVGEG